MTPLEVEAVQYTSLGVARVDSIPTVAEPCSFWESWIAPLGTVNPTKGVAYSLNEGGADAALAPQRLSGLGPRTKWIVPPSRTMAEGIHARVSGVALPEAVTTVADRT